MTQRESDEVKSQIDTVFSLTRKFFGFNETQQRGLKSADSEKENIIEKENSKSEQG